VSQHITAMINFLIVAQARQDSAKHLPTTKTTEAKNCIIKQLRRLSI